MDDHRPIQPDDPLPRARAGDLDAFVDLVRAPAGRLLRLALIAAGERSAGERVAAAAIRTAWRDARALYSAEDLDDRLARGLVAALPRRRPAGAGTPLDRALGPLAPADRVALARCQDAAPDDAALTVAGRAGVESGAPADGDIVDLDGPLAGWDLARLRAALAAAAGSADVDALLATIRADLGSTAPEGEARVALRSALPGRVAIARVMSLAVAVVVGAGLLGWTASTPDAPGAADHARDAPASGIPQAEAGAGSAPGGAEGASGAARTSGAAPASGAAEVDTPGDFPATMDGLPVFGVNAAKRLARDARIEGRAIAVRGWLTAPAIRGECAAGVPRARPSADPLLEAAFCLRDAVLREAPDSDWSVAHLHAELLPGTGLGRLARAFAGAGGGSVPAVVIAHYRFPLAELCALEGRHCGEHLVIDRIAWALGAPSRPPTAVRPTTASGTDPVRSPSEVLEIAEKAYGGLRVVSVTGVAAADLGLVEPAAAAVLSPSGFAWLVRAILEPGPFAIARNGAARTWLVVDDRTGEVTPAPGAVASSRGIAGPAALFPKRVDGALVRGAGDVLGLAQAGLPAGATVAVAGWLAAAPVLAGSCIPGPGSAGPRAGANRAFCRRTAILRGPTIDGPAIRLQLPPGTPELPIDDATGGSATPVPVVALVEAGSPRSEPCSPGRSGCDRPLVLERLLWVDGIATDVAVAELDAPGALAPRLSSAEVRVLAEAAIAGRGRVVSIVRVPSTQRGSVAPGSAASAIKGDHAWVVRVRSPMIRAGGATGLDYLWWLLVDDTTGRTSPDARPIADLPGTTVLGRHG